MVIQFYIPWRPRYLTEPLFVSKNFGNKIGVFLRIQKTNDTVSGSAIAKSNRPMNYALDIPSKGTASILFSLFRWHIFFPAFLLRRLALPVSDSTGNHAAAPIFPRLASSKGSNSCTFHWPMRHWEVSQLFESPLPSDSWFAPSFLAPPEQVGRDRHIGQTQWLKSWLVSFQSF